MMPGAFVVDNSVVMAWCFEDEANRYSDSALEALNSSEAVVPAVWPLEVGNVLLVAERKGRLSQSKAARFLSLLGSLPIRVEQETPQRALTSILALARGHHLSTYDASYLDLAMRAGLPLATLNSALTKAARRCRVPLLKQR